MHHAQLLIKYQIKWNLLGINTSNKLINKHNGFTTITLFAGSGPLIDLISRQSGRTPLEFAKPSEKLKDYVFDMCNVKDPSRCLMIGDS